MVDSLEKLLIELVSPLIFEGDLEHHECICQTLDADTDRSMSLVGVTRFLTWVVVVINDLIEVSGDHLSDFMQLIELENPVLDVPRERYRCEVAHRDLIRRGVLDDLAAEVAALDGPQVLVV